MFSRTLALFGKYGNRQSLGPLTSKRASTKFYKGVGATKPGLITRRGGFTMDPQERLVIDVPADLAQTKFRPYVDSSRKE